MKREFVKTIMSMSHGHNLFDLFRDFCELSALSLVNAVDRRQTLWQQREERYLNIVKRYTPVEIDKFCQMLAFVIEGLELERSDFMGEVFAEMEQHNSHRGQFFTPYDVSRVLARITIADKVREIDNTGFVTLQEPSMGSGGMVVAFSEELRKAGYNPQTQMHVVGVDVDSRAVHMAYIQLTLLHIPAVIYVGNTLTMEMREEWKTPAHIMGGWDYRQKQELPSWL